MIFFFVLCLVSISFSTVRISGSIEANQRSQILVDAINDYRQDNALGRVPYSESLSFVGQNHCDDSQINTPSGGSCNLHSWSDDGPWTGMCYTSDHAKAQEMWDKPRELTSYTGNGYEISVGGGGFSTWEARAQTCVNAWDSSQPHKDVILENGWSAWVAVGCGMSESYCHCWFGYSEDPGRDSFRCSGRLATNEEVCGGMGKGICQSENECVCWPGYSYFMGDCQTFDDGGAQKKNSMNVELVTLFFVLFVITMLL